MIQPFPLGPDVYRQSLGQICPYLMSVQIDNFLNLILDPYHLYLGIVFHIHEFTVAWREL